MSARLPPPKTTSRTRLLISLIDWSELKTLDDAGYPDFIDVKDPSQGSLGFPKLETVKKIAKGLPAQVRLSVAIGDAENRPVMYAERAVNAIEAGADIIKVGLFKIPPSKTSLFLEEIKKIIATNLKSKKDVSLVAGLYADRSSRDGLLAFPKIVSEAGWDGCLVDTYEKRGEKLTNYLDIETLAEFVKSCRSIDVVSVIAGSLSFEDLTWIERLSPSVAGFRSAVAKGGRGNIGLDEKKVSRLKIEIATQ